MEPQPEAAIGRQVALSGVWSAGGQITVLGASLVATPFTVRLLGPSSYGLLALVNSIIAYVTVLDLGMGSASTRFGSLAYARGDAREEAGIVWTAALIAAVPTTLLAAALWLLARPLAHDVLHIGDHLQDAAVLALRLGALALLARVVGAVLNTSEQVRLRWDLLVGINTFSSVLQIGMVPVVLAAGHGVVSAVVVILLAAAGAAVAHLVVSARLQPALRRPRVLTSTIRPLLAFGGALFAANGLALVLGNSERFLLARYEPISSVGAYAVASNIAALLAIVPIALCQPLLPAFARLAATEEWERVERLYRTGIRYVLVATLPTATVLAVIGRPFLRVWAGEAYAHQSVHPLWILLVGVVFNAVAFLPYNLLLSLGDSKAVARVHLMELPMFVVYAPLLVAHFGAAGAAATWTVRTVIATGLAFRAANRHLPRSPMGEIVRVVGGPACLLAVPLASLALTGSEVLAIGVGVAAVAAYGVVVWRRVLDDDDRTRARAVVRRARRLVGR